MNRPIDSTVVCDSSLEKMSVASIAREFGESKLDDIDVSYYITFGRNDQTHE